MKNAPFLNLERGVSRESPVIAFTEPSITDNRESAIAKGNLDGTRGTYQI